MIAVISRRRRSVTVRIKVHGIPGVAHGRAVQGILSGVSNPILGAAALDAPVSYEGLAGAGGAAGRPFRATNPNNSCRRLTSRPVGAKTENDS